MINFVGSWSSKEQVLLRVMSLGVLLIENYVLQKATKDHIVIATKLYKNV